MSLELIVRGVRIKLVGEGPFKANTASVKENLEHPYWMVQDQRSINVLTFPDGNGRTLTTREFAEEIADKANAPAQ